MIDLTFLENTSGGDKGFIKDMLEMFVNLTPESINNLEEGIANKDFNLIKSAAHKMKPSMGFMGLNDTQEACQQVENASATEDMTTIEPLVAKIKSDCTEAFEEIRVKLENY